MEARCDDKKVKEVFDEFKSRRNGVIKALTTEYVEFHKKCDPGKENLCLFGLHGDQWEVDLPAKEVPPKLPEPVLGINFARDEMEKDDWLSFVANHSDVWLLSVSFYNGARNGFNKPERRMLFNMMNDLPTVSEAVNGTKVFSRQQLPLSQSPPSKKRKIGARCDRQTVKEVFDEFKSRRAGIVKALTAEYVEFHKKCDPGNDNLCLFGHPGDKWEVNLPAKEVPPKFPEPVLGINFVRDGMEKDDWLSFVADHSDVWLLSLSFYIGAKNGFNKQDRRNLFSMMNELPTVAEYVNGTVKSLKSRKMVVDVVVGETLCLLCELNCLVDELWIKCDYCRKWIHGVCAGLTQAEAEEVEYYKCPRCEGKA